MEYNPDYAMAIVNVVKERLFRSTSETINANSDLEKDKVRKEMYDKENEKWGGDICNFFSTSPSLERQIEKLKRAQENQCDWQAVYDYAIEVFIRDPKTKED